MTSATNASLASKAAELLAWRIEQEIVSDGWKVGTRLGSEPELMARYGVSRSVMREAIRLLEHHQVARTREGRGGGLVVTAPDGSAIARSLELYLQYRKVTLLDLLETKRSLELSALPTAAARMNPAGAARLRAALAAEATHGEAVFDITDANLHIVLAELTGNPALHVFVKVLTRLSASMVQRSSAVKNAPSTYETHRAIAEAVIAGNSELAQTLLEGHLHDIEAQGSSSDR